MGQVRTWEQGGTQTAQQAPEAQHVRARPLSLSFPICDPGQDKSCPGPEHCTLPTAGWGELSFRLLSVSAHRAAVWGSSALRAPRPTHKAVVHDPAQALQRLQVLGEVELHQAGVPEEWHQRGLRGPGAAP